ncbi:MAG TPA: DUF1802 family protein [Thermoanaerobaculia bacterium]
MRKLANHTALKEWSSVIDALGRGDQVILIRKGGIADPKFGVEASQFYLYPTYFHQGESDHRPAVSITHWCEVARTWSVRELEQMERLAPHVAIPRATLESRYRFRPDQALHIIGVRTYALSKPAAVMFREEYAGCLSWISVEEEIDVDGSKPVLRGARLDAKLADIDALLTVTV